MAHDFKRIDRDQAYLLPPDLREWLPAGHLAWLVLEVVDQLDLTEIERRYRRGGAGRQAYPPAMLVALLLYAYAIGVRSSRRIERACETDVAFRVIAANLRPDHVTIARFRATHQHALTRLHAQVLGLCVTAGLVDAKVVAVDSTKVAANASGAANLTREQLEQAARDTLEQAAAVDADEDARYGPDRRGDEPAEGFQPGAGRAERIRQALRELDRQTDGRAEIEARQAARVAAGGKRRGRPPLPPDPSKPDRVANRQNKAARKANTTDPQSRMMKTPKGFVQGYTCQAVATEGQIVLAGQVTNDQNDAAALVPMLEQVRDQIARAGAPHGRVRVALADKGYWNGPDIATIRPQLGIVPLVSTAREATVRSTRPTPPVQPALAAMHHRLQHPVARRLYRRRAGTIEPVFGQMKTNRNLDRFLRRGLDAANAEWQLEIIAHNLTKLWRARPDPG